jgi:hypothetical protein
MKINFKISIFLVVFFSNTLVSLAASRVPSLFQLCSEVVIKHDLDTKEEKTISALENQIDEIGTSLQKYLKLSSERISPLIRQYDIKTPKKTAHNIKIICLSSNQRALWVTTSTKRLYKIDLNKNPELKLQGDFFSFKDQITNIFPTKEGVCGFLESDFFFTVNEITQEYKIHEIPNLDFDEHIKVVSAEDHLLNINEEKIFTILTDKNNFFILKKEGDTLTNILRLKTKTSLVHLVNSKDENTIFVVLLDSKAGDDNSCLNVLEINLKPKSPSVINTLTIPINFKVDSFVPNPFIPYEIICFNKENIISKNIHDLNGYEISSSDFNQPEDDGNILNVSFLRGGIMAVSYDSGYIKTYDLRKTIQIKEQIFYLNQSLIYSNISSSFFEEEPENFSITSSCGGTLVCYNPYNIKIFTSRTATAKVLEAGGKLKQDLLKSKIEAEDIFNKLEQEPTSDESIQHKLIKYQEKEKIFKEKFQQFLTTFKAAMLVQKVSTYYYSIYMKNIHLYYEQDLEDRMGDIKRHAFKEIDIIKQLFQTLTQLDSFDTPYHLSFWARKIRRFLGDLDLEEIKRTPTKKTKRKTTTDTSAIKKLKLEF